MLCRVAEDVFWMSRYVERALAVGRLVEVVEHMEFAALDDASRAVMWSPLLAPRPNDGDLPASLTEVAATPQAVRAWLAFDRGNPRSIVSCVGRARSAARRVRERISGEMWEALNELHLRCADVAARGGDGGGAGESPPFLQRAREAALLVQGLADVSLAHDEAWHFAMLGKYLERADNIAYVLALQAHLLRGGGRGEADMVRWLAVLRSAGCDEAYARFYSLRVEPARVVEFLLLNARFPRTVRFSLRQAWDSLAALTGDAPDGGARPGSPATRALGRLTARLEHTTVDEIMERGLQPYLASLQRDIADATEQLTRTYLRGEPPPARVAPVARAAMLLADQQQQQQQQ
jgi:uncharacterized alpha-E superfamily protein